VENFPNDPELIRLYAEKTFKQSALAIASVGVDVAEGVSVTTLEATKWVMDKSLGGLFDVKTVEFTGTFGLSNQYKVNAAINFTLTNDPYNMVAELDFADLATSAGKLAKDILSGNLIKPGFAPSFAANLKKPVSNTALKAAPAVLPPDNRNIAVVQPTTTGNVINIPVTTTVADNWTGKLFRIENLWQAGQRVNVEDGSLVASSITDGPWASQWLIKPVPGTKYYWIQNRLKASRLNVEKGFLEASVIQDGAWSAHWELKKIGPDLYWIENRWQTGQRINVEKGKLDCSVISDGANSAMWYIRLSKPELSVPKNTADFSFNGLPFNPEVFDSFVPGLESGEFKRSVNMNVIKKITDAKQPWTTDFGFYSVYTDDGGSINYKYLGKTTDGLFVFHVVRNWGGSFSFANVFIVERSGNLLNRKGMLSTPRFDGKRLEVQGNGIFYDGTLYPVSSLFNN